MLARGPSASLVALLAGGVMILAGCGATAERGAETFYREHGGEAAHTAEAVRSLAAEVAALGVKPTPAALENVEVQEHRARRALLAAAKWSVLEDGEEEGVSQAEREISEATGALLKAAAQLRLYAQTRRPASLSAYRSELSAGREYWDQGVTQLWYVSKHPGPPKI